MNLLCPWDAPTYLIFSSNIPSLLYYSHLLAIVGALIFGALLFFKSRKELAVKLLIINICLFAAYVIFDVVIWASNRADVVLFYWGLVVVLEILTYATAFYFSYVFVNKKDLPFGAKVFCVLLVLPVLIYLPSHSFLTGVDISTCNANENSLINNLTTYGVEIAFSLMTVFTVFRAAVRKTREEKKQLFLFLFGILIFLIAFSFGNIIGSITDDWDLAQYGLFGMPIFIGLLTYLAVKFKAFNIKLFAAQALVIGLGVLVGSEFFFATSTANQILIVISFVLVCIGGYSLIKSVRREIEAKEKVQKLAADLQVANTRLRELDTQKTEFISFATHQLRSPLTAMKGNASLILEGDLGPVNEGMKGIIQTIYTSIGTMINIVEDYLNVSRIELGTMKYNMVDMDFKDLVKEVANEQKPNIDAKGLQYSVAIDENQAYKIKADPDKFKQVLMNTIDNSIKYTPAGSLAISLAKVTSKDGKPAIQFKVADTGVGIRPDVLPKLFQKFTRAPNASESNIHGTGLGLFIAKEIMNAHAGRIWAESAGEGKGSQFYVELPEVK